jgi:hypothetical protein
MGMPPRHKQKAQDDGFTIQYNYKLVKYRDTSTRCRRTTWESLDALIRNDQAYKEGIMIQNLENDLDSCKANTENKTYNYHAIADAELQLKKLRKEDKSFHTIDYEKEIAFYNAVAGKVELEQSLRKTENMYLDSIITSKNDTSNGNNRLHTATIIDRGAQQWELVAQMDAIAPHHCLSTFSYTDLNLAQPRLNKYLASTGLVRSHDSVYLPKATQPVLKYTYFSVSGAGISEYKLSVIYYLQNINNNTTIQSCEILGDTAIIKNLFIKYWPINMYGGDKYSEAIANKYFFSDFVSLAVDNEALKIMICPAIK